MQINIYLDDRQLKIFFDEIQLNEEADFFVTGNNIEILPKLINKRDGIMEYLKIDYTGIKKTRIIAIGDNSNDLSMYEIADIKIASQLAIDEVKRESDYLLGGLDFELLDI